MKTEKVFIVISHKNSLKKGTKDQWEVSETVEFVNQLRNKHITMSSAVGDYINRKILSGARFGIADYGKFEDYVRTKYKSQMAELDLAYESMRIAEPLVLDIKPAPYTDQFGLPRERTVFDV